MSAPSESSKVSMFIELEKQHPLAARVLAFLRHTCPSNLIHEEGWVNIGTLSYFLKASRADILAAIKKYHDTWVSPDPIEIKNNNYLRSLAFHSIDKVRLELIHSRFEPEAGQLAYFNLCNRNRHAYREGGELRPPKRRIYTNLYLDDTTMEGDIGQIVVDLEALARVADIHYMPHNRSVIIRGSVPAECIIKYIELPAKKE